MPETRSTAGKTGNRQNSEPGTTADAIKQLEDRKYKDGFVTEIEQETVAPGLDEDVIRLISD